MNYNYFEEMEDDVRNYIDEEINFSDFSDLEELEEYLNDQLWVEDSVTGNTSGSYTFNTWQAEENLCHNWDLLKEALEEFGESNINVLEKGAEWADVTIRCYLLSQVISKVLPDYEEEFEKEDL